MKPPKSIAPVARKASANFPVNPHAATKVGAASMIVIASCVFPEGIHQPLSSSFYPMVFEDLPAFLSSFFYA
jgi:hypothetical protein